MDKWRRQKQTNIEAYSEEQVQRVLQSIGIDTDNDAPEDFIIFCPYHSNFRTPAAEVSKTKGTFFCFGCQETKTLPELVMHVAGKDYFQAMRLIDKMEEEGDFVELVAKKLEDKKPVFVQYDLNQIQKLQDGLKNSPRGIEYFKSRGIWRESFDKYLLGYSSRQDMIVIPEHSPTGMVVGFVGRSVEGKTFKNSFDLPRNLTLFNLWRCKYADDVFVVESALDAINLEQAGFNAVATLGNTVSRAQKELLKKYFSGIIVVSDNDQGGQRMEASMKGTFGYQMTVLRLPEETKDVTRFVEVYGTKALTNIVKTLDNDRLITIY